MTGSETGRPEPHEVDGVEYVPVCDHCWEPAEQFDVQDANGQWRHGGFRHLDPALNPPTQRDENVTQRPN